MFGRPLCTAAFVFALAVFITLQIFPPQLDPYPELDREEAVLSGTIDAIEFKQDYKQSYARRGAQDGQQKHEEPEKGEISLRVTVKDYTLEQVGGRDLRLQSGRRQQDPDPGKDLLFFRRHQSGPVRQPPLLQDSGL